MVERVDVSESAAISTGIAARYATAMFDLATEAAAIDALAKDVDALEAALAASADLRDLISSPIYRRDESQAAVGAVAKAMKLGMIATNTLQVMAQKRRLFVLPMVLRAVRAQIAESRGEMTAEVVSAKALTKTQADKLAKSLSASAGKKINLNATVDESLIGGLIVKVGSKMIDSSIRSKLNSLQNTMKEVG
jgi:F-type H+-transporting ATPase subunit delta